MDKELKRKLKSRLTSWASVSTVHTLPKLATPVNSLTVKLLYTLFTLTTIALLIYMTHKNLSDYLSFDVTTKINIINESPINFPTITICDINPFHSNLTDQVKKQPPKIAFKKQINSSANKS